MKKSSIFLFLLFFVVSSFAQSDREKEVQKSVKQFFDAFSTRDSVAMKRWSTADLTLIEYGMVWNMDTLIKRGITENAVRNFNRVDRFEFLSTTVQETMALVTYRLTSFITADGRKMDVDWIESMTLCYVDQRWKVKFLHSTLLNRHIQ
ncbi:MAG: nuclear transport factor 2 family protein [Chitinophagaceae bacterium]